jgi:hypothetical protein
MLLRLAKFESVSQEIYLVTRDLMEQQCSLYRRLHIPARRQMDEPYDVMIPAYGYTFKRACTGDE